MKVCSKCGANNGDEAKFCTRCSSAFQSAGNLCLSGRHIMYPTWTECFYCRSEGRLEGVTSDAPLIPRRPPLPMPAPNAASARLCPNGRHTMDPTWTECPFCVRSALARESERFRVFISSTFIDLQEYRQAVFSSILALGNTGEDMVHWSADADWSAPEQVLGQPVSPASDIYPFGRLICHLIGGELTGEVRKFVGSAIGPRDEKEFDVFYDPFVRLQPENAAGPAHVLRFWTDVARSCLRFLPSERPQDMRMLVDQISSLLEEYPLQGTCSFRIENRLVMATFLDGGKGPARLMSVPSGN
jgi:hypothetical protein